MPKPTATTVTYARPAYAHWQMYVGPQHVTLTRSQARKLIAAADPDHSIRLRGYRAHWIPALGSFVHVDAHRVRTSFPEPSAQSAALVDQIAEGLAP